MAKGNAKGKTNAYGGVATWQVAVGVVAIIMVFLYYSDAEPAVEKPAVVSTSSSSPPARKLARSGNKRWQTKDESKYGTDPRIVHVAPNGGGSMQAGKEETKEVTMDMEIFASLHKKYDGRLYNGAGEFVRDFSTVAPSSTLYTGPNVKGTHFMWPTVKVGHKVEVPGVKSPSGKPIMLETLSHSPRAFYVHNLMSKEETDKLIAYSTAEENPYKMAPSTAGTHKSWAEGGRGNTLTTRTSMNAFDMQTKTADNIKRRAFDLLRINTFQPNLADGIQILRYELGQAYIAHHDYFPAGQSDDHNWNPENGGSNRWATVFLYLSDVEYGGQTVFPEAARLTNDTNAELVKRLGESPSEEKIDALLKEANLGPDSWEANLIRKCYTRFAVPPRKGDAILFYSQLPTGKLDPRSLHGACPVLTGAKWGANLWVWNACRFGQCRDDPMYPAGEAEY